MTQDKTTEPAITNREKLPIGRPSSITLLLYEILRASEPGATVAYEELNEKSGVDVQDEGRGYLVTARKMANENDHMLFDVIKNVGLYHMPDETVGQSVPMRAMQLGKYAGIVRKRHMLGIKDWGSMPADAKISHQTGIVVLNLMQKSAKPKTIRKISQGVAGGQKTIELNDILGKLQSVPKRETQPEPRKEIKIDLPKSESD